MWDISKKQQDIFNPTNDSHMDLKLGSTILTKRTNIDYFKKSI